MKRFALAITCAMMLSGSGCCLFGYPGGGWGAGYPPTYGGAGYGGGACPTGACGTYPGAYSGGAPTAVAPYGYPQTAVSPYGYPQTAIIDPVPVY